MAKRQKAAQPDPKKPKPKQKRWGKPFHFWVNPEVRAAFDRFIASFEYPPKENDVLEKWLLEQLGTRGFWNAPEQGRFDELEKTRSKRGRPKKGG